MLPCQIICAAYYSGCHKSCPYWKRFQQEQKERRQAQKRYLDHYMDQCAVEMRQYRAMQPRYPTRL